MTGIPLDWVVVFILGLILSKPRPAVASITVMFMMLGLGVFLSLPSTPEAGYALGANLISFGLGIGIGQIIRAFKPKPTQYVRYR